MAVLAGGCSGSFEVRPHQELATHFVWHDVYGRSDEPPQIEWIAADDLGAGQQGMTFAGWKIMLACGDGCTMPVENTNLAHELMHERTFRETGDVDVMHYRGDWKLAQKANDDLYGIVNMARTSTEEVR